MTSDLDGATVQVAENVRISNAGEFAAYWNALSDVGRAAAFTNLRTAQDALLEKLTRIPELEQLRAVRDSFIGTPLVDVHAERMRQDAKWGEQNHLDGTGPDERVMKGIGDRAIGRNMQMITAQRLADQARDDCKDRGPGHERPDTWTAILLEEVFEALAESDPTTLRRELVQVAAVAVQWIEAIDRREHARTGS